MECIITVIIILMIIIIVNEFYFNKDLSYFRKKENERIHKNKILNCLISEWNCRSGYNDKTIHVCYIHTHINKLLNNVERIEYQYHHPLIKFNNIPNKYDIILMLEKDGHIQLINKQSDTFLSGDDEIILTKYIYCTDVYSSAEEFMKKGGYKNTFIDFLKWFLPWFIATVLTLISIL